MEALLGTGYKLFEMVGSNWKPVEPSEGVAAFIDGGSSPVFESPSASVYRIRTAAVIVKGNRIAKVSQKEGYLLAKAVVKEGRISCQCSLFDSSLDDPGNLEFQLSGLAAAEDFALAKAADAARRLCELAAASRALSELKSAGGGFLVLDGTLEAFSRQEREAVSLLASAAKSAGIMLGSVAKTCSLLTISGDSLISAAHSVSQPGSGFLPVAEGISDRHRASVAIARLNSSASHLFRVECQDLLAELVSCLAFQSNDLVFPGYPYGLIMADRFARISAADSELTRAKVSATATGELRRIVDSSRALDAHSILDGMPYSYERQSFK